jgi:hypothetical protein
MCALYKTVMIFARVCWSCIRCDGPCGSVVWKGRAGEHAWGGAHKKIPIGPPGVSSHGEGERVGPRLGGHTTKPGVPHASWRWSQGQRPVPACGTPPRARRPAAADGGGSGLSPSPRLDRCRRRPAAGVRPAGRTASRPARGWGGVRKRRGQLGAGRRWRGCHGQWGFILPILCLA